MPDPLDVLHIRDVPVSPSAAFSRSLLERVHAELQGNQPLPREPRSVPSTMSSHYDVLDEALLILEGTAPEYDPYGLGFCLSNHASMVAETMCALGRPEAVIPWVNEFRRHLIDADEPREPVTDDSWRLALGKLNRVADWSVYFAALLDRDPWRVVLNQWLPRLAPGSYAVHGLLRTAHAVRGLGERETEPRRRELMEGLAYWAACYEELPRTRHPSSGLSPALALLRVEQVDVDAREHWMQFTQPIEQAASLRSFAEVTDLVAVDGDPSRFLSELSETMAAVVAANAFTGPTSRGIVHGLTAGTATRMMLPHLDEMATKASLRYGWQVAAAFYAGLAVDPPFASLEEPDLTIDELIDRALACPDEHGVKVTEACLREYALNSRPIYLAAAHRCTEDLFDTGLRLG